MNILLLGSNSFIGRHVYNHLNKKFKVNSLNKYFDENDILKLTKPEFIKKYFNEINTKIDVIINLVHIHKKSLKDEYDINTKFIEKICFYVDQQKIRIIHISSVNCSNDNQSNKYSYTKSSLEEKILKTNNFTILRLSTVISVDKNNEFIGGRNGKSLKIINFFVKKVRFFPLIRNGNFLHTVCFLEDIDNFIFTIIKEEIFRNKRINFFSGQYITFKELIILFAKSYNKSIYFINIPEFIINFILKINNLLKLNLINEQKLKNLTEQNIEYDHSNEISKYIELKKIK